MRILLIGMTGRIGRLVLERAIADGHDVTALVRDASRVVERPGLTVRTGDVADRSAVGVAVAGVDAVIVAIGPRENTADAERVLELGMRNVVDSMRSHGVQRVITLSGAAVDAPGDDKPALDRLATSIARRFARHVVNAKQREFETLKESTLDWTALRPPLVSDGVPRGYELTERLRPGTRVTRADVAHALVDQLTDRQHLGRAPFVLPKRSK